MQSIFIIENFVRYSIIHFNLDFTFDIQGMCCNKTEKQLHELIHFAQRHSTNCIIWLTNPYDYI